MRHLNRIINLGMLTARPTPLLRCTETVGMEKVMKLKHQGEFGLTSTANYKCCEAGGEACPEADVDWLVKNVQIRHKYQESPRLNSVISPHQQSQKSSHRTL